MAQAGNQETVISLRLVIFLCIICGCRYVLDTEALQRVFEVLHDELWAVVGQQTTRFDMSIQLLMKERISHSLERGGNKWDRSSILSEAISDHVDVFVARFGLQQGTEKIKHGDRKRLSHGEG